MLEKTDLLGAIVAHVIYVSSILTFISRLLGRDRLGQWFGYPLLLTALPLGYLLLKAPQLERPALYYIQIGLMLVSILLVFLLDYALKFDFRQTRWMVISFVVLYFAGTGGMLGVCATSSHWYVMCSHQPEC
jgi:Ca2+/Na+ antiporter